MVKLGFVTCVQLGLSCMQAIYEIAGKLDLVVTLHDDKAVNKSGRVFLDEFCRDNEVELFKCDHINADETIQKIRSADLDWLFIIGWSQIASADVLAAANLGVLGAHPSLLPEGRGRAAVPWAILKGLDKTGVTLFKLDEGVDTGEILHQIEIPVSDNTTATQLYKKVDEVHVVLMKKAVPDLLANRVSLRVQDNSLATYWEGRKPEDGEIDMAGSVHEAERLVRAVTRPYPGAYVYEGEKKRIVWSARVSELQTDHCLKFFDGFLDLLDSELLEPS